ncbi:hypothetical protein, partial [Hydrogenophaga sp.]|uniref:RIFT barrel domain-containing protein n=1 Tax=Hydrogenophaga sp. TaxID=1904254 RepID=UPI00271FF547
MSSATAQSSVPVTFGQPFRSGDWPTAQGLTATDSTGAAVPIQADEISTHKDGTVRFAVLSAKVSNVQANQPKLVNFFLGAKSTAAQAVPADPDWNLELEAKVYSGSTLISTLVAKPQDLLKQQIAQNKGRRLNGAVATEYTVIAPFKNASTNAEHAHLSARLHTRLYESGARIRTDVVLENNWTFKPQPANITYELNIKRNGQVVYTQPRFTHYHHARWHKVVWTGTEPQVRVRHNMPYFLASKATLNYDLGIYTNAASKRESVLAQEAQQLAAANTSPMGPAFLSTYFPGTGGRPELGLNPRWTALYLVTQDDRARASMFANANAAAGVPMHYRNESTDNPLDITAYPNLSVGGFSSSPVVPTSSDTTVWEPDSSHQGSFAYMPYLISGDAFYQDETMFWASWNIARKNPEYRGRGAGLVNEDQTRGQAWVMRSLAEAAYSLPDTHPMKAYFQARLAVNLDWYAANYANNSSISPMGVIQKPDEPKYSQPWQNDFFAIVFSWLTENKEPKAVDTLNWISKFNVGRYSAESQGFCTA